MSTIRRRRPQENSRKGFIAVSARNRRRIREVRAILNENYPTVFVAKGEPKRPLAMTVGQSVLLSLPEIGTANLTLALNDYCSGPSYLGVCVAGAKRIDLEGREDGIVTLAQAEFARQRLEYQEKKWATATSGKPMPAHEDA